MKRRRSYDIQLPGSFSVDDDDRLTLWQEDMAAFATAVQHAHARYLRDSLRDSLASPWAWRQVTAVCWAFQEFVVLKRRGAAGWHVLRYGRQLTRPRFQKAETAMRWAEKLVRSQRKEWEEWERP